MAQLTEDQLQELSDKLHEEQRELNSHFESRAPGAELAESETGSTGELSSYDNHPGDLGTETFERERDLAIDDLMSQQLAEVEAALGRLADGSYGLCEVCGESIPFERLQALPAAKCCVEHASEAIDAPLTEEQAVTSYGAGDGGQSGSRTFDDEADAWKSLEQYGNASGTVKPDGRV